MTKKTKNLIEDFETKFGRPERSDRILALCNTLFKKHLTHTDKIKQQTKQKNIGKKISVINKKERDWFLTERMLLDVKGGEGVVEVILVLHQRLVITIDEVDELIEVARGAQRPHLSHVLL